MSRVSKFASDLVQDLRDRRLLIPAIGLIVAIVAVPLLLGAGGGADEPIVASAPAEQVPPAMKGSEEVEPVVLADVPGLRDYRKRLEGSKGRNPFVQQTIGGSSGSGSGWRRCRRRLLGNRQFRCGLLVHRHVDRHRHVGDECFDRFGDQSGARHLDGWELRIERDRKRQAT